MNKEVTGADIERFMVTAGPRAARVLKVLGKTSQFYNAVTSPIGQELLVDTINNMEMLLEKIVNEEANEKDRADYRAFRAIALSWSERIGKHLENIQKIKNV